MKSAPSYQKLRGGYYTPIQITDFLAKWAIQTPNDKVLEPSSGDGAFVEAAVKRLLSLGTSQEKIGHQVNGIELDPSEAMKIIERVKQHNVNLGNGIFVNDFFGHLIERAFEEYTFDVVLGNPPFIKYQNFNEEYRKIAFELMQRAGMKPNKLTNIWVPFLILSTLALKEKGRLGMVIPAELFQVDYAAETRQFLSHFFDRLTIITFTQLVFEDAQQEVVLLLGERDVEEKQGIRTIELNSIDELKDLKLHEVYESPVKPLDHSNEKWTKYFLDNDEILLLRKLKNHPQVVISSDVLDVDVGVVTGRNDFFVLSQEEAIGHSILQDTIKIVGRSNHLSGITFNEHDYESNINKGYPSLLFFPNNLDYEQLDFSTKSYIRYGESLGVHEGYKCRIRKRWYIVPSVRIPDAFMLRQVHEYPKVILNEVNATSTDTIHRVKIIGDNNPEEITTAFLNSLTFAFAEITGRSYGGGVLTFEPSEAERLPLPLVNADKLNLNEINALIRNNKIEAVLDITDRILLMEGLGLTEEEVKKVRGIWTKLKDRRINRKKSRKKNNV